MQRTHYLVWRRGFAPILFILAIALIVVSIGSGIYFATRKNAPAIAPQNAVVNQQPVTTTTTEVVTPAVTPIGDVKPSTTVVINYFDCGTNSAKATQCLAERIQTCSPAKGTVVDAASGLTVERIIDGYKGVSCSYRSNIISGTGSLEMLTGMNIDCMIPKARLAATVKGGSMSKDDLLTYCTGSFIDLVRMQIKASAQ